MSPADELKELTAPLRSAFGAVAAFSLAINLLMLAPAVYMLQMYDRVLTSRNETTLLMLTLILAGLLALDAALEWVRSRVMVRVGAAFDLQLNPRIMEASFARALSGSATSRGEGLADLATLRQFLTGKGLFVFFDAPFVPIFLLVIFLLDAWLGLFALVSVVLLLLLAWLNERLAAPLLGESARRQNAAARLAGKQLRNAEIVAALGMAGSLRERWLVRHLQFLGMSGAAADRAAAFAALTRFTRLLLQSGILGAGAWLVLSGRLTPGGMIAASILLGRALSPVDLAISTWQGVVSARQAWHRLDALLQQHPAQAAAATVLPRPSGQVQAEQLVVAAPGSRNPIIRGARFQVMPGKVVAIVGPSASGKSTLARALVGIWRPLAGAVRLDGADVHNWDRRQLGPFIGYLPQDIELFDGTIAENIARFGTADSEQIVAAARRAGVHEMVLGFPAGYDTVIGENGAALSAGQRQRIGLARALYGDPALIVLDEPDASLDEAGEAALRASLLALKEERRTVFVVTHRATVLSVADQVMVLVDGQVKAFGDREQVLKPVARNPETAGGQGR